jgi:hypothetical protein
MKIGQEKFKSQVSIAKKQAQSKDSKFLDKELKRVKSIK